MHRNGSWIVLGPEIEIFEFFNRASDISRFPRKISVLAYEFSSQFEYVAKCAQCDESR